MDTAFGVHILRTRTQRTGGISMAVQITAGVIFIVMFILIVSEAVERHRASLLCGLVMLVLVQGIMMRDVNI